MIVNDKYAISVWFGYDIPLKERFKLIKSAGFTHVNLWWADDFNDYYGDKKYHPLWAKDANLEINSFHLPYSDINLFWEEGDDAKAYFDNMVELLVSASEYKDAPFVLHPIKNPLPKINDVGLNRFIEFTKIAEELNLKIALENLFTNQHLLFLLRHLSNDVGLCFDSGHMLVGETTDDIFLLYGGRIDVLHLHDNDGINDLHLLPFEGKIDWVKVVNDLVNCDSNLILSLESMQSYDYINFVENKDEYPNDYLDRAYRSLMKLVELSIK